MTDHSKDVVVYAYRTLTDTTIVYDAYLPSQALLRGLRAIGPFDYSQPVEVTTTAPILFDPEEDNFTEGTHRGIISIFPDTVLDVVTPLDPSAMRGGTVTVQITAERPQRG